MSHDAASGITDLTVHLSIIPRAAKKVISPHTEKSGYPAGRAGRRSDAAIRNP
jgi:hypothetical protein